jgi:hypothetical protein
MLRSIVLHLSIVDLIEFIAGVWARQCAAVLARHQISSKCARLLLPHRSVRRDGTKLNSATED